MKLSLHLGQKKCDVLSYNLSDSGSWGVRSLCLPCVPLHTPSWQPSLTAPPHHYIVDLTHRSSTPLPRSPHSPPLYTPSLQPSQPTHGRNQAPCTPRDSSSPPRGGVSCPMDESVLVGVLLALSCVVFPESDRWTGRSNNRALPQCRRRSLTRIASNFQPLL